MIPPDATPTAAGRDTDDGRLARQIVACSRSMYERGWMPGTSGNLSARLPGPAGNALIIASGRDTELPVFPNHAQVQRIAHDVARYLSRVPQAPPGLLIADHGITAWGNDLPQARNHLECLESISQLLLLGAGPRILTPADAPGKDTP
jgi:ribulose-5-phosphate 4-epimerase/fuculose-1-phosphate aldolase